MESQIVFFLKLDIHKWKKGLNMNVNRIFYHQKSVEILQNYHQKSVEIWLIYHQKSVNLYLKSQQKAVLVACVYNWMHKNKHFIHL